MPGSKSKLKEKKKKPQRKRKPLRKKKKEVVASKFFYVCYSEDGCQECALYLISTAVLLGSGRTSILLVCDRMQSEQPASKLEKQPTSQVNCLQSQPASKGLTHNSASLSYNTVADSTLSQSTVPQISLQYPEYQHYIDHKWLFTKCGNSTFGFLHGIQHGILHVMAIFIRDIV